MKVTNWRRKLIASLVAGGTLVPGIGYALDIPLGDPSFENYVVPASPGYAYAVPPNGSYRPTSPWVDDLDSPTGFTQDAGSSNWIYDANYAETASATNKRAAPRTGNQAMHGLDGNFNAQKVVNVFEADKTYTFSVWAQNDLLLDQGDGVGLYVFDGNVPFTTASALGSANFTTTVAHRTAGMTAVQSKANWGQLDCPSQRLRRRSGRRSPDRCRLPRLSRQRRRRCHAFGRSRDQLPDVPRSQHHERAGPGAETRPVQRSASITTKSKVPAAL